jgi:hypothetical protein
VSEYRLVVPIHTVGAVLGTSLMTHVMMSSDEVSKMSLDKCPSVRNVVRESTLILFLLFSITMILFLLFSITMYIVLVSSHNINFNTLYYCLLGYEYTTLTLEKNVSVTHRNPAMGNSPSERKRNSSWRNRSRKRVPVPAASESTARVSVDEAESRVARAA